MGPQCPLAAQNNVGIFDSSSSSTSKDNFRDVILLVACNFAYYDMLQNWEFLARELGIKWAVLAMDETLYDVLGPERAISPGEFSVSGAQSFRQGGFNKLSCNKMRMAMSVAENCGMDVVFSDVDNIFYQNPFEHDLGRLIESRRFDYLYQPNIEEVNEPLAARCLHGEPLHEANTGFYYFSRNSQPLKKMVNATLESCSDPNNRIDDQALFWLEFWKVNKTYYETNKTFHHCRVPEYLEPSTYSDASSKDASFNYCCLDPYNYPVGNPKTSHSINPVTYHANFCIGKDSKINKLRNSRSDGYGWNASRITLGL
jgi:hypothetical protein